MYGARWFWAVGLAVILMIGGPCRPVWAAEEPGGAAEAKPAALTAVLKVDLKGHADRVSGVAFLGTTGRVATASQPRPVYYPIVKGKLQPATQDPTCKIWDIATGKEIASCATVHMTCLVSLCASPDGRLLASSSLWERTGNVALLDLSSLPNTPKGFVIEGVGAVCFAPRGPVFAISAYSAKTKSTEIRLWEFSLGKGKKNVTPLATIDSATPTYGIQFSADMRRLLAWSGTCIGTDSSSDNVPVPGYEGNARIKDIGSGKEVLLEMPDKEAFATGCFSPDGAKVVTGHHGAVRRRDIPNATTWDMWNAQAKTWDQVGGGAASRVPGGKVQVWDAATGERLFALQGHTNTVNAVGWSPNGKYIATGSVDKTVRLWDATTGAQLLAIEAHSDRVDAVDFSPDTKRTMLITGSGDKTAKVWEIQEAKPR